MHSFFFGGEYVFLFFLWFTDSNGCIQKFDAITSCKTMSRFAANFKTRTWQSMLQQNECSCGSSSRERHHWNTRVTEDSVCVRPQNPRQFIRPKSWRGSTLPYNATTKCTQLAKRQLRGYNRERQKNGDTYGSATVSASSSTITGNPKQAQTTNQNKGTGNHKESYRDNVTQKKRQQSGSSTTAKNTK